MHTLFAYAWRAAFWGLVLWTWAQLFLGWVEP